MVLEGWKTGWKGEELAPKILSKAGFTIIKFRGKVNEPPFNILAPPWHYGRYGNYGIEGSFAYDLYAEKGGNKWFIDVKTTKQKREHGIHLSKRKVLYGYVLTRFGYNIGILRIRLAKKNEETIVRASLHRVSFGFFSKVLEILPGFVDFYPKTRMKGIPDGILRKKVTEKRL